MMNIKRILFPTDFTVCSENAFARAVDLVRRFGAELHIVHGLIRHKQAPINLYTDFPITESEIVGQLHLLYERQAQQMRSIDDVPVIQCEVEAGSASMAILEYEDQHGIDLIVMGTHGRCGIDRFILGSVAEEVVRLAGCPVLTVHSGEFIPLPSFDNRILVPVDFSDASLPLVVHASELAATFGAGIDLLHVLNDVSLPYSSGFEPLVLIPEVEDRVGEARAAIEELARQGLQQGICWEPVVRIGSPEAVIVEEAARRHSGLITIASHGRTSLRRMLMGSVAGKVVRHAQAPVFTLKTFGRQLVLAPSLKEEPAIG